MRTKVAAMMASGLFLVLSAAACNGDGYGGEDAKDDKPAAVETPAPTTSREDGEGGQSAAGTVVKAVDNPRLGEIVVDGQGRTLYRFDQDSANPPKTTCVGECLRKWPALLVTDDVRLIGVDPALVGTVKRPDGKLQVTLNGWALYTFANDTKAGDVNGQGVGGTWFAATPQGKKAVGTAPATPSTPNIPTDRTPTPSRETDGYGYDYGY